MLREGDKQIPIVARLRMEERAQLADVQNLYVYSMQGNQKVPLRQVSSVEYGMQTEKVRRRNQFRTITVSCMAEPGHLPSEIVSAARPQLTAFAAQLPPGYHMDIGGSEEEQVKGFKNQTVVLIISVVAIFLSLVYQFKNAIKPLRRLRGGALRHCGRAGGAVDYGHALRLHGLPGNHQPGRGDRQSHHRALRLYRREARGRRAAEGGGARCRHHAPAAGDDHGARPGDSRSFPLAMHGGPLWEPMCYAQMGGMMVATFITLLLVPVIYSIFVLDLKLIKWETKGAEKDVAEQAGAPETAEPATAG